MTFQRKNIVTNTLTSDVTISASDPTFTDLVSVTIFGGQFLIQGFGSGLANGNITPRLRVLVDGVEVNYLGTYGSDSGSGSGVQLTVIGISNLSVGLHTFKLQASYGGSTGWTIHANTNPTREIATLVVMTV